MRLQSGVHLERIDDAPGIFWVDVAVSDCQLDFSKEANLEALKRYTVDLRVCIR